MKTNKSTIAEWYLNEDIIYQIILRFCPMIRQTMKNMHR